jgi:hypothetical protein
LLDILYFFFFLILISFDLIPELMGVPSSSFTDTYSENVTDLMIKMVEYIQALDNLKNPASVPGPGPGPDAGHGAVPANKGISPTHGRLEKNRNGFPILPDPISSDGWKKTTWDALFTDYLGKQYHMATGGKIMHIPYKLINENQREFIDPRYLPRNTIFRPPRNIVLQEIKGIFEYLLQRQRDHGPEDTFIFKSIKSKGNTVPSQYKPIDNNLNESQPTDDPGPGPGPIPNPASGPIPNPASGPDAGLAAGLAAGGTLAPNSNAGPNSYLNTPPPSQDQILGT